MFLLDLGTELCWFRIRLGHCFERELSVSCLHCFHDVMFNIKELLKYAWNCSRLVWWYFINYRRAINDVQFGWVHLHHHHQIREEGLWFVVVSSSEAVLSTLQAWEQNWQTSGLKSKAPVMCGSRCLQTILDQGQEI